ncbi:MAG: S9 family peptidase [Bacteroidetes bacterium HGW-Bacteroidetes-9]|nr:MAG: S9 family peptidase [Bacteroidetes bacterium HGW-Bacteroidetes-9]
MRNLFLLLIMSFLMTNAFAQHDKITYPKAKKTEVTDDYFGTKVADPYRWLEDDNSAETAKWVKAENKVTDAWLEKIPFREELRSRLTKLWNYPRYGVPFHKGKYYFFTKNNGIQNQSVLYVQDSLNAEPRVFLDPNQLSPDGTTALSTYKASRDGSYFAYAIAKAGSDWNEIYVIETATGKQLSDKLEWVKFSDIAWKGKGFYYSRYGKPGEGGELSSKNEFKKVYYHIVGDPQEKDQLVYENKNEPLRSYGAQTTSDENFLLIFETESTSGNALFVKDLRKENGEFVKIADGFQYDYEVITNYNNHFIIRTNDGAPRYRLISVDFENPAKDSWKELVPEKDEVLQSAYPGGGMLICKYMKDATSKAYVYHADGSLMHELLLPEPGTINDFESEREDGQAFFSFSSFTSPSTIYKFDIASNRAEVFHKSELDFDASEIVSEQVFYTSKDGTRVPMFLVHRSDVQLDGNNPVFLYGYGGFNVSLTPGFSASRMVFIENGGIFAMANLRGGGEYGEEWHRAGTKLQKQNVFDDFIAAAEYLIEKKYTNPKKIAIAGGSNGGLLVGACMTQRPDLFAVALPAVGVMDMLRFHKFTIGWAWTDDYGSSDNEEEFRYLLGYSPLHNLKTGTCYPATLVTTADHDDRVVPAHSFKFAATLQEKQSCEKPVLIRIETKAGHGAGKPISKMIDEAADMWSFTMYNLGMKPLVR